MKKISTISTVELAQTIKAAERIFDMVRLVDPNKLCVIKIDEEGNFIEEEECFACWGYEKRCSNCTGICAFDTAGAVSKTERMGKISYQVTSNILYAIDAQNKMKKLVIELLAETVPEIQSLGNTVLVVDDQAVNRMIAGKILANQYNILEASDGQEALERLEKDYESISAMILDLIMPGYDGYTVLRFMKNDPRFAKIPVLVMTGDVDWKTEKKCLEAGAWDIIAKPVNKDSLRLRIENIIGRSRYDAQKFEKYLAEHDALTGLFNRTKFFHEIHKLEVNDHPSEYALLHIDIDRFRLYNSFFGEKEGDKLLVFFANLIREYAGILKESVICHMEADVFGVFCRYDEEELNHFGQHLVEKIKNYNEAYYIEPSIGVYINSEKDISVENMFNRAAMAAESCKHKFMQSISYYSDTISNKLVAEQEVMNEAQKALDEEQFEVYLQPKTNIFTEDSLGAEALVRWIHPEKGMIAPGRFIPIFESNGFIGQLDYYMWDHTCKLLRKWLDEGLEPTPVSVNVSRANMYNPNLIDMFVELMKKYNLSPKLLQLELTESAFMDDPDLMIEKVKELQKHGFTMLMDDFGSGYSSLNTLKDIPVDILKVDLQFMQKHDASDDGRSERILASIVRMAEWLDLMVIVEGVETLEQRNFLESIGCEFAQGFYYARPMPWQEYENMLRKSEAAQKQKCELHEPKEVSDMISEIWTVNPKLEHMFHTTLKPVALCRYDEKEVTFLRVNPGFIGSFGYDPVNTSDRETSFVPDKFISSIRSTFKECCTTYKMTVCEYMRVGRDGESVWYQIRLQHIITAGNNANVVMAYFENINDEKLLEFEVNRYKTYEQEKKKRAAMLIVDDSNVTRYFSKELFKDRFEIYEAGNGKEALEVLKEHGLEVAVILLDMNMPVMDGQEFLKIKNKSETISDIPVVVISAEDRQELQIDMLKNGVNDYITKPFVPEILERRVFNVLEYSSRFKNILREYRESCEIS